MFYVKKYRSIKELQKDIIEYVNYYNKDKIEFKRNEPDAISSSCVKCLIINFV